MNRFERAYIKLTNAAPAAIAARIDALRPSHYATGPLNGQRARQRMIRELVAVIDFDEVVETGTYHAASTLFFSHVTGLPVNSVELLPRYSHFAKLRCANDPNIQLRTGDSRDFLRQLAVELGSHTTLFYLDAHWEADVPRFEELEIICAGWTRAVVLIDDFAVSDDPGYGFTRYGDIPLTMEYLPPLPGWTRLYPEAPASQETGARRGCVVLSSPALSQAVGTLQTLRPAL